MQSLAQALIGYASTASTATLTVDSLLKPNQWTTILTNVPDGQMHEAVAAIAATGVSPLVRIAANEAWMVKSVFYLYPFLSSPNAFQEPLTPAPTALLSR